MIEMLGMDSGSEYEAAKHLRDLIIAEWPSIIGPKNWTTS